MACFLLSPHEMNGYLQNEQGGPCEGGNDEENGALEPVLVSSPGGVGHVGCTRVDMLRPHHLHHRAFVQRHQHGPTHCHYRPHYLHLVYHLLQVYLLHPTLHI